jgi:hypothetical protein
MVISCVGMYRSGSTLTFNIVNTIVKNGGLGTYLAYPDIRHLSSKEIVVCKYHDVDPKWDISKNEHWKKCLNIYTFRDIRDVLSSFCVWYDMGLDNFNFQGNNAAQMIDWLIKLDKKWKSSAGLILKYDDYHPYDEKSVLKLTNKIINYIDIHPPKETINEICEKYTFKSCKDVADQLLEGDKTTLLNPRHLADGKIGKWRTFFSLEDQNKYFDFNDNLNVWLGENGFSGGKTS